MSGLELKKILSENNITLSELAKMLGYANDQRLHSALKAADVKSGLIEEIAKAINKNVGYFYGDSNGNIIAPSGGVNTINSLSEKFIGLLEKKDEQLDRLLGLLEATKKQ